MRRPTIRDLAEAADVSVATVNRVLAGSPGVRQATMAHVREVADEIGFYGANAIQGRIASRRPTVSLGFLLHQPSRPFYQNVAQALRDAAASTEEADVDLKIEFLEDLSPESTSARMRALGRECDALGVVAAVHPLISQAISDLDAAGKPVFALISQLAASGQVHYVGLDNWKVGRTAAWAMAHLSKQPGKLGLLVGNHRYRCQEMNEAGFRSYFREFAPDFTILEPLSTFETRAVAREMTEKLMRDHPDLVGLFISGGGISGAIAGLQSTGAAGRIVAVGYELMDVTRAALLDGTLSFLIAHPLDRLARQAIDRMTQAVATGSSTGTFTSVLPFEIYTRENI